MAKVTTWAPGFDRIAAVITATAPIKILALETSTEFCSVALLVGEDIHGTGENAGQRHSELLLPMVDEVLGGADLKVSDLDAIAFGAGPGSFTGLRIACGVAQGLAFSADRRCIPVGSLEALAQATGGDRVVACTDARMGQVYLAAFERDGAGWREVLPPSLCSPDELPQLSGSAWLGCGSGFERYPQIMAGAYSNKVEQLREGIFPHARDVAVLGAHYLASGRSVSSAEAAPIYVRNKVALTMKEQG